MSISVFWDDLNILTIEKEDNLYISKVNYENLKEARKTGFPIYYLKQISLVSDELAPIVRRRIPSTNAIKDKIKFKDKLSESELEKKICQYINENGCRSPIDKFSINIEIK